jgi:hypothetical protein
MMPIGSRSVEIAALRHAVPYLALFRGRTFVVKVGGGALADPRALVSGSCWSTAADPRRANSPGDSVSRSDRSQAAGSQTAGPSKR